MSDRSPGRTGWPLLFKELTRHPKPLVLLTLWSIVESLPSLLSGVLVAAALDRGFIVHRPLAGLGWLGLLGLTLVIRAVATRNTFPWMADMVEPLRDVVLGTVVHGALERAVEGIERPDGAAVARLSGQAEMVRNLVAALIRMLRPTVVSITLALIGLFALAPTIAGITAPMVLLSLALFAWSLPMVTNRRQTALLAQEDTARISTAVFGGLRDVIACGGEDPARESVDRAITAEARSTIAATRAASVRALILPVGTHIPLVLILILAPWLLRRGLSAGELVGAVTYMTTTLDPALRGLTGILGGWGGQLSVLLRRIKETSAGPSSSAEQAEPQSHDLRISSLTFAYGPHADPVINDLTLDVPAGQHLAIVGPSGIGKSTLASLVTGLASAQSGTVLLGGLPIERINEAYLRRTIALIPQEAFVFTGSLRENLTYLRPTATSNELNQAVEALGMRPLVDRLGGYDSQLGVDGPVLSNGERQLIALARVYISSANVIVMDEATCNLDPAAEAQAEEALAATGRTLIVIAHRISSARRAQRVLVLDGTSAMAGSHDELINASPLYADLVGRWSRHAGPPFSAIVASTMERI